MTKESIKVQRIIVINGRFLEQQLTGVQRFALEITKAMDKICKNGEIQLVLPGYLPEEKIPYFKHIKIIRLGKNGGIFWEQWNLALYIKKIKALGVHLCNSVTLLAPYGIVCIHDITYKVNPQFITTKKLKLISFWHNIQTSVAVKKALHIITVSEFSKQQIIKFYHAEPEKISVVYNGWQHFETKLDNTDLPEKYFFLKKNDYYFSMATLAKNKNFKWIVETARYNPTAIFAVAGSSDLKKLGESISDSDNIYYLGYISDSDAKLLMKNCKAFIFPSLFEGFGIPPLEALAMGAQVVCSNATSLPELFEDSVHYIDPYNSQIDIDKLIEQPTANRFKVLKKFSWEKSAEKIYILLIRAVRQSDTFITSRRTGY